MDIVHERAAGMDISKRDAKVCIRIPGARAGTSSRTVTTYGSTTNEIMRLRRDLEAAAVTVVVMEATGDYWRPFYFLLSESLNVQLVNAKAARNIPGRKSDVADATWLAELAAHNLLRASFVPPEPIRQLRDLTRTRSNLTHERTREYPRLEKGLEDSSIKLSSVVSTLSTRSARSILDALISGERDPQTLASLAHARWAANPRRSSKPSRGASPTTTHSWRGCTWTASTSSRRPRSPRRLHRHGDATFRLGPGEVTVPGISKNVANVIIAEAGVDMTVFDTAGHLASWAGVCPSQNESPRRIKSTQTRPGDHYLKAALGIAALAVSRSKTTYLAVKYRRVQSHAGALRAVVALQHTLLVIVWNMLHDGVAYDELGVDHYDKTNPDAPGNASNAACSRSDSSPTSPHFPQGGHLRFLSRIARSRANAYDSTKIEPLQSR
ncbi:transposase [Arthrobacter globiformis]|uniref:IS110 family transposase n=1 Tax=Arthrobacter globiformis TaxID=1665 RepID=UPI0027885881|nr:IS110 family transposase [Arthrobacter globiformis]MDQ1058281.1 transposase [Arthrobacter globiformis]